MSEAENRQSIHEESELNKVFKIRLKVIDRETGEHRYCSVMETKTWDWANPEYWRIVNGWQITSFKGLLNLLHLKAQKGCEEIVVLEAPRFTMLSGG